IARAAFLRAAAGGRNGAAGKSGSRECGKSKRTTGRNRKSQIVNGFRPSIFSFAVVADPAAGVVEGPARRASGVRLFVGPTGARNAKHHAGAGGRVLDVAALADSRNFHRRAGAAAVDEKPDDGEGERRG